MNKYINKNIELLSPSGSFECARAAVLSGADAVYMGGTRYSARAYAKSASDNSLEKSIKYVKENGKCFYLTVNTLFKQRELKEIFLFLDPLVDLGVDAFIVQDLGVAMMLKDKYPNVELHASTQMNITSSKAINLIKQIGFTQVVLARELSLNEIKKIKKEIGDDIKLEAFVHGSMCYSYSGCCLMSSFIGGESGNRGRCKGPCRLPYSVGANVKSKSFKAKTIGANNCINHYNGKHLDPTSYILSMKDMCALNSIKDLIEAGVTSFKIEGRMRQADYVAGVTKTYRKYLDLVAGVDTKYIGTNTCGVNYMGELSKSQIAKDEKYLLEIYNKGGFTNYYDKHNGNDMIQRYERRKLKK